MSGRPYPEGVAEVIENLETIAKLESEIEELEPRVRADVARLKVVRDALAETMRLVESRLEKMDVTRTGNFGWPGRFGWLLGEFMRQIKGRAS